MRLFVLLLLIALAMPSAHATTILLPDGASAVGAKAVSLQKTHFVHVLDDGFERPLEIDLTSADGELEITEQTAGRWIILHSKGWADTEIPMELGALQLNAWNTLDGKLVGSHGPDTRISYARTERPRRLDERGGSVYWSSRAAVEPDGSFRLTQLPNGPGVIGLFREVKTDRRISRWRDFPQAIYVPTPKLVLVGGKGVEVRGKIAALTDELPALLTLLPQRDSPPYHGLTDAEGNFAIPGVIADNYQLTARASLGSAFRNPPTRTFPVADIPIDLGVIGPTKHPFQLEVDRRVEITDEILAKAIAAAGRQVSQPIEKIWVGELGHPTGNYGVRVACQPTPNPADPTRAIRKMLVLEIPGESIRKFYPEHDSLGHGFRFVEGDIEPGRILENDVRVFPLKNQTLSIPIEPEVDYETYLRLLIAIERGTIDTPKPKSERTPDGAWRTTFSFGGTVSPEIFPDITHIRKREGQIEIQTHTRPFGRRNYQFEATNGGFLLTNVSSWRS